MRSTIRAVARRARLALLIALPLLLSIPAGLASQSAAQAATTGDLVFMEDPGTGTAYITLSNSSGGSQTHLASGIVGDPAVSPDGSKVAYYKVHRWDSNTHGGQGLWVMNSDGSGDTQITFPDTGGDSSLHFVDSVPRWSTDGTKVVFTRYDISGGLYYVYSASADGTGVSNLTSGETSSSFDPDWSPDGSSIVYTHLGSGGYFNSKGLEIKAPAAIVSIRRIFSQLTPGTDFTEVVGQ